MTRATYIYADGIEAIVTKNGVFPVTDETFRHFAEGDDFSNWEGGIFSFPVKRNNGFEWKEWTEWDAVVESMIYDELDPVWEITLDVVHAYGVGTDAIVAHYDDGGMLVVRDKEAWVERINFYMTR